MFPCLDLQSGYWQIEAEENDKPKTAFAERDCLNTVPCHLVFPGPQQIFWAVWS